MRASHICGKGGQGLFGLRLIIWEHLMRKRWAGIVWTEANNMGASHAEKVGRDCLD